MHSRYLLAVIASGLVAGRASADLVLVADGRPRCVILIPGQASAAERFAAEELARYIEAISSAQVAIAPEGERAAGVAIHIGRTQVARAALPAELSDEPEGVFAGAEGDRVIICGGSDRGTLFAVYRFLEEALGCRWLAPDVEFVPHQRTIRIAPLNLVTAPAFDIRTFVA
ncbi:MAG: hypothetical protein ACE5O2_15830, partial [Armatimonadota bacterium]